MWVCGWGRGREDMLLFCCCTVRGREQSVFSQANIGTVLRVNPACAGIFPGPSHPGDFKIGTPVATLPGAFRYRVSAGTGWPGVGILCLGEMLLCGLESRFELESSDFSMWHFLKLAARGFLRVLRSPLLLHRSMVQPIN